MLYHLGSTYILSTYSFYYPPTSVSSSVIIILITTSPPPSSFLTNHKDDDRYEIAQDTTNPEWEKAERQIHAAIASGNQGRSTTVSIKSTATKRKAGRAGAGDGISDNYEQEIRGKGWREGVGGGAGGNRKGKRSRI